MVGPPSRLALLLLLAIALADQIVSISVKAYLHKNSTVTPGGLALWRFAPPPTF